MQLPYADLFGTDFETLCIMTKTWLPGSVWILFLLVLSGCTSGMSGGNMQAVESGWILQHGGVVKDAQQSRAQRLCNRLCNGWINNTVRVRIIDSQRLGAWTWPDRDIYISLGLVSHLNNGELSAAIAHEMGHLINSRAVQCPYALGRSGEKLGIEAGADLTGSRVLVAHGISPQNLIRVLQLLYRCSSNVSLRNSLQSRIHALSSAIASGRVDKRRRNASRARDTRDRTVPTGTPSTSAASS